MHENVMVSVIVPVYNQEDYLNVSIPSILNQTYSNIEVVIVNDGSTDQSANIIKKYEKIDRRIKVITKKNGGLVSASVTGVRNSEGKYICFLDPDDYYGKNFIKNFMIEMDEDTDVVAAGFYQDNNGYHEPIILRNNTFLGSDLEELRRTFLIEKGKRGISNQIFISRWNKCYKASVLHQMIDVFAENSEISLGEDTLFTYLVLRYAKKVKALEFPNEYFYNIGNQSSMMKNDLIQNHMYKSKNAYTAMKKYLCEDDYPEDTAYALYYFLIESLFNRVLNVCPQNYKDFCALLKKDKLYYLSTNIVQANFLNKKDLLLLSVKRSKYPELYFEIVGTLKKVKPLLKLIMQEPKKYVTDLFNMGFTKAYYLAKFRNDRRHAFEELNEQLPELEKRIYPYIKNRLSEVTMLEECPIEKNIFVFWWDGFENAPRIVKCCLASIKQHHHDYNVIEVTKDTYFKYTDIDSIIIEDFKKGKISVQTFSDILRFNLLKNNGGIWIDATIYFASKYDMLSNLEMKSFESVIFSSSESFLQYQGLKCSWSGYYISSRKDGVFVSIMNDIFRKYYLEYKTYSIYFFIDAAFMICKKYKVDDGVLDKVQHNKNSMFLLSQILSCTYDERLLEQIKAIPQKLSWFGVQDVKKNDSVYNILFVKNNYEKSTLN